MKAKQAQLIDYLLQQQHPTSARILAEKIGVSVRTIKNYIYEINQSSGNPVILSSQLGYQIEHQTGQKILSQTPQKEALPQNFKERSFYLIKKSLIENRQLNIFDLSEELFVSYATLKTDVAKMNQSFAKYHVKFMIKNDTLQIIGEEKDKRQLLSYVIFEEVPHQFINQEILAENFNQNDVTKLANIITETLQSTKYRLNDFSFINLMLHLLILLESVRNDHSLISRNWFSSWLREDKAKLVTQMIHAIEKDFDLILNHHEKEEIHMIFQANVNYIPSHNLDELEQIVGADIMTAVQNIVSDTCQTFGVNLTSESFLVPFSLHISGLFSRAKQATSLKNPMLPSMKKDFPIVYDIAVFIALRLNHYLAIDVAEDEAAYIALHVGSELEQQKKDLFKISTVLLCPQYMNLDEKLYEQLHQQFGNDLKIEAVISDYNQLKISEIELLITTLPVPVSSSFQTIQISPIFTEEQRLLLLSKVGQIRLHRKHRILAKNFDDYFDPQFFTCQKNETNQMTVLKKICQQLESAEIVSEDFYTHVLERELASSTAFEAVAIPHSVYMEAEKTTISIFIAKDGIQWGAKKVQLVLLAAINEVDRRYFTEIYEALISVFDSAGIYQEIKEVKDFESFRKLILAKI
ncbi:BglG family transcription antiterminator [Enterococcus sp. AZ103]|uniref:BglG family transcription antiterminator n=1 Tax=Enterococcus sp. AZ103 TaxID=2774628 RepID=UPI003F246038